MQRNFGIAVEFLRFFIAGGISTIVHWLLLWILIQHLETAPIVSTSFGYIAGAIVNYTINYFWTFKSNASHFKASFKFAIVALSGFLLNALIFSFFNYIAGTHYFISQFFATGIVLFWNFIINRFWTFKAPQPSKLY